MKLKEITSTLEKVGAELASRKNGEGFKVKTNTIQNLRSVASDCYKREVRDRCIALDDGRVLEGNITIDNLWINNIKEI